jgi:hypothetical protein
LTSFHCANYSEELSNALGCLATQLLAQRHVCDITGIKHNSIFRVRLSHSAEVLYCITYSYRQIVIHIRLKCLVKVNNVEKQVCFDSSIVDPNRQASPGSQVSYLHYQPSSFQRVNNEST